MNGFEIGKKVVCVEARPTPYQSLRVGHVYTIRGVWVCAHGSANIDVGARSPKEGMPCYTGSTMMNECYCERRGVWHRASRFRPLLDDENEAALSALEEGQQEPELIETL
jgi:hypothetical protein